MEETLSEIFNIDKRLVSLTRMVEEEVRPFFLGIERVAEHNQGKVINSFQQYRVSDFHFHGSSGYGYDDPGREMLEQLYAKVMGSEAALVRPQIVSGTHAIALSYFGILRPGDELLSIGQPYDTLKSVIDSGPGSLREWGITYREVSWEAASEGQGNGSGILSPQTRMISIQRSRGYSWEASREIDKIANVITAVKRITPEVICFVDNCYGEFVEDREPTDCGADLIAGSLIKNPGGGLANGGGYIAGRSDLVEKVAHRLSAPGLGRHVGAVPQGRRLEFQGLFLAPQLVAEALKGAVFAARLLNVLGFEVSPSYCDKRTDIIQAVRLGSERALISFCHGVQKACPINAHYLPEPASLPGYQERVIMAAGGFVQGGSLELSCDAPLRPPYVAYFQGGLSYFHAKLGVLSGINEMLLTGEISL